MNRHRVLTGILGLLMLVLIGTSLPACTPTPVPYLALQGASATMTVYYIQETATAWPARGTATAETWQATQTVAAISVQATAQALRQQELAFAATATNEAMYAALNATATAQARAFDATATAQAQAFNATATAQAWNLASTATAETYQQRATATAAAAQATATVQAAEAERLRLQAERERLVQPLRAYGPWLGFFVALTLFAWGVYRLIVVLELRGRALPRDDRGDAPIIIVERGPRLVLVDPDRLARPTLTVDTQGAPAAPALVSDAMQERTTARDQAIDLAHRGLPAGSGRPRVTPQQAARVMAQPPLPAAGGQPPIRVLAVEQARPWLRDVRPQLIELAITREGREGREGEGGSHGTE